MITTLKDQAVQHECLRNKTKNMRSVFCYAERTPLFKLKQFTHSCQEKVVVIVILLRSRQAFHGRNKVGPQCLRKRFGTFDLPQIQQIFLNTANIFSRKLTHQPNHQQNDAKHDLGERNWQKPCVGIKICYCTWSQNTYACIWAHAHTIHTLTDGWMDGWMNG